MLENQLGQLDLQAQNGLWRRLGMRGEPGLNPGRNARSVVRHLSPFLPRPAPGRTEKPTRIDSLKHLRPILAAVSAARGPSPAESQALLPTSRPEPAHGVPLQSLWFRELRPRQG